ncbi:NAD-dependent epimerase/dehydratase family protein [Nitratireductor basaltis]|uniref:NAD-dependent epimerase/dehydratase n=1 Tax=Nitratireductor basaltis TaxID=472175 RepID=A0A084UAU0_9HYPH|nr:NAD-dependent epimerase/dehydratase family protein [Nitratireductor basaltis]KFB10076.1 NAD-dependent epimerase/dehydratase [Nitratireductor basaltis]
MSQRKDFGFVEWFRPGEYERTEQILPELKASGARYLRTHLSWAEYLAQGGPEWFDWLLPRLAEQFEVLPCVHYTPPSISRNGKSSGAPKRLQDYADFVDHVLTRYGAHFTEIELWNEPNNLLDWDWRIDQDFQLFCEMVGAAAYWAQKRGWKAVLGGPSPFDPYWVDLMGQRGLLDVVSAVGIHGFPGTWDSEEGSWNGWNRNIDELREIVDRYNPAARIWITETGYSTWRNDEVEQGRRFLSALDAAADRMYWYSWRDVPHDIAVQEGHWFDVRHYHLGAVDNSGKPKLLSRLLKDGGIERVREVTRLAAPARGAKAAPILITGGSGFIGSNLADSYLADGHDVIVLDNISRPGVDQNLNWLKDRHKDRVHPLLADIRDMHAIRPALQDARVVFHLAAQTAVTTSLEEPFGDFEVNARGTLNILEGVRAAGRDAPVIFASTNKVYGALLDLEMIELEDRYVPASKSTHRYGIAETRPLEFCTPYGCSKGVADQYVLDYAKTFGVPSAVMRMSCIYGPRQFGTEDQGWVAHFLIRALDGQPITIFGDGKQVRDILHVNDAVKAYRLAAEHIGAISGKAYNLGGGPANAVSLQMVLHEIGKITGSDPDIGREPWRPGDQHYYVSDTRLLQKELGWQSQTAWREGLQDLADWLCATRGLTINNNNKKRMSA